MKHRGFSLLETIIAGTLVLLLSFFAANLFVRGWQTVNFATAKTDQMRAARKAVDIISQNILESREIYSFRMSTAPAAVPSSIVLKKLFGPVNNAANSEIVEYVVRSNAKNMYDIYEIGYPESTYDANNPPPPDTSKVLAERVKNYNISYSQNLYSLDFTFASSKEGQPDVKLKTTVARRR